MIYKILNNILEEIADLNHKIWQHWMRYLFSKTYLDKDGNVVIPKEFVDRWHRQMDTPYSELSEKEKESDIEQAHKFIDLLAEKIGKYL